MAANTAPIFSKEPQIGTPAGDIGVTLTAANTAKDGTGTVGIFFTAGADGGNVERVRAMPLGTNVATVLRIFVNNGGATTTARNNSMICQMTMPATTNSENSELLPQELPNVRDTTAFPLKLPAGYRLFATIGTAVAAGIRVTAPGGKY
jgi:hypothetical protein